jgi:hypothetical protein
VSNQALVARFRAQLDVHYQWFSLARTAGRGDGLVVLVRHGITIMDRHDIFFRDLGDRVALLLRLDYSSITKHGVGGWGGWGGKGWGWKGGGGVGRGEGGQKCFWSTRICSFRMNATLM